MALINSDVVPFTGGAYELEQSLRFNDDDSAYLSWTPSSAGNRKTWTWSGWVKRSEITKGSGQYGIFNCNPSGEDSIRFDNTSTFNFYVYTGGYVGQLNTSALYRDASNWYHIVCVWDTTNSTSTDRMRLYINGERVTDFNTETYPALDSVSNFNSSTLHRIGNHNGSSTGYLDGYLAEVHFIDGQALDPTSFGKTGTYGEWKPIEYTGSYGTNGFYLPFKQDYQVEGFSTTLYRGNGATQYIGGVGFQPDLLWLKTRNATGNHLVWDAVRGTNSLIKTSSTQAEESTSITSFDTDGFTLGTASNTVNTNYVAWSWDMGGDNTNLITNGTFETLDNWTAVNYNNFSLQSGFMQVRPSTSGGDTYAYQDITTVSGSKYKITFDTGATNDDPQIWVVGSSTLLSSGSLSSNSSYSYEFTADSTSTQIRLGGNFVNESAYYRFDNVVVTLVAVANTNGSITSLVRANPTYGQSIVKYTGNLSSSGTATVGHGLSSAPEMVITKATSDGSNWIVRHTGLTNDSYVTFLNLANAETDTSSNGTVSAPTSSVFTTNWTYGNNESGVDYIAYCFHSVSGYSKFGTYTGDGTTDGSKTISLGFKPAFLIIKRTDGATDWKMFDNARNPTNPVDKILQPNLSNAEGDSDTIEFNDTSFGLLDNGGAINNSGSNYIYMAFADTREFAYWLDQSGNNNDWTSNNLTESDISVDSPTNNFATLNAIASYHTSTVSLLSEGNLKTTNSATSSDKNYHLSTIRVDSGKWYMEYYGTSGYTMGGVTYFDASSTLNYNGSSGITYFGMQDEDYAYFGATGQIYTNSSGTSYGATYGDGDIIGVALDLDSATNTVTFYKNNTSQGSYTLPSGKSWAFGVGQDLASNYHYLNFGQDSSFAGSKAAQGNTDGNEIGDFYYTPPSGYLALCTANLPDPAVIPSENFNTVLWSGNATSPRSITGVGFQPDWTWLKQRSGTSYHGSYDVVRGATKVLFPNDNLAEITTPGNGYVSSFDSDGFTLTDGSLGDADTNDSGHTYVAWNWKANGSGSSNTNGTITSTVSANQDAGFSIVTYTGNGVDLAEVGHGLTSAPDFYMVKNRDQNDNWKVGAAPHIDRAYSLHLNDTNAASSEDSWGNKTPTSTVVKLGQDVATNTNGEDYIMYCFKSTEGFSKVGTYIGDSYASNGQFIYTGFRPAFVMVKVYNEGASAAWNIFDNERSGYNADNDILQANTSNTENTNNYVDLVSNGFKYYTSSGGLNSVLNTYLYIAFAEIPFKYANGR